jgi:formamidopyrimidine-DNA glycosylase
VPELPEVETMCRGIYPIIGKKIKMISVPPCSYRPIQIRPLASEIDARMSGRRVKAVIRIGKRVVIQTDEDSLILQPKMTGLVALDRPPDEAHVRLRIDFTDRQCVQFWDSRGLGTVELLPTKDLHWRIIDGKLGPDALDITADDFTRRLGETERPIKVALLDQKILAGVGNLYASEMLFAAGINPNKSAAKLSTRRLNILYEVMQQILRKAIEMEGSTLSDGTYRNAVNDPGSYQNMHQVYDHAGDPCPKCKDKTIRRIVQAQRSTFYCPGCQRS